MSSDVLALEDATLTHAPATVLRALRAPDGPAREALAATLGVVPADRPGAVTRLTGGRLLWQRPGGWLAVIDDPAFAMGLDHHLAPGWTAIDVSDALTAFRFDGPQALGALDRAGPASDALRSLRHDREAVCTRLRLAQLSVLIESPRDDVVTAWVESSLAAWWWRWWQAQCTTARPP